jgi:hypothetical protein
MEHDQLDKMLDEWLDRASEERGNVEPRPGFEQRMIAGIHNRAARKTLFFGWRSLATAATVVVVACMFLARITEHRGKQTNLAGKSIVQLQQHDARPSQEEKAAITPHRMRKPAIVIAAHTPESLPRQDVFPSAQVSQRDRLLFDYIRAVKSGKIDGVIEESQGRPIEISKVEESPKTEISQIDIKPLSIEPLP